MIESFIPSRRVYKSNCCYRTAFLSPFGLAMRGTCRTLVIE